MIARYWRALAMWALALAGVATATGLVRQVLNLAHPTENPIAHGAQRVLLVAFGNVGAFPYLVALFLPIAAFAAGLRLLPDDDPTGGLRGRGLTRVLVAVALTGVGQFLLLSYIAPICMTWFPGLAFGRWQLPRWEWIGIRPSLLAMYEGQGFWADPRTMMPGERYNAGVQYHLLEAKSIVVGFLALIGALVSVWTRSLPAGKARLQHWGIGLFFLILLQPVQGAVIHQLSVARLAPVLVAYSVLIVPATFLLALAWAAHNVASRP